MFGKKVLTIAAVVGLIAARQASAAVPVEWTVGMRAGAGFGFKQAPTDVARPYPGEPGKTYSAPFFNAGRGGFGYTLEWYGEVRIARYVGLEVGVGLTRQFLQEDVLWRYEFTDADGVTTFWSAKTRQELSWVDVSLPIIAKAVWPVSHRVRLWLGIGPEFHFGRWARGSFDVSSMDKDTPPQAPVRRFRELRGRNVDDIYLASAMGIDLRVGGLVIPIAVRFGWNLTEPRAYADNVKVEPFPQTSADAPELATVRASATLYVQLVAGLAWDFGTGDSR